MLTEPEIRIHNGFTRRNKYVGYKGNDQGVGLIITVDWEVAIEMTIKTRYVICSIRS